MDQAFLEGLGLDVRDQDGFVEAELELTSGQAMNPLTRQALPKAAFTVIGDRLIYVAPPELVGGTPINLAFMSPTTRLEDLVLSTLNEHLFQLERRSNELSAMGLMPKVDPATLQLTADVEVEPLSFSIGANRQGQFRVVRASHDGAELTTGVVNTFELSEFRDRKALEDFLFALYSDVAGVRPGSSPGIPVGPPSPVPSPPPEDGAILFRDLLHAFGEASLPPRSALEVVATLRVKDQQYRFAAARMSGTVFRGLIAGASGKIWSDRFTVSQFPGIRAFLASILEVDVDAVEVIQS